MAEKILTQSYLRECVSYDKDTGIFYWRERPRSHFRTDRGHKVFLSQKAGKPVGTFNKEKYLIISIDKVQYYAHRLAWLYIHGYFPSDSIDHINGDRGNNRIKNLREVTRAQNQQNLSGHKNNKTGIMGVFWCEELQSFIAYIQINKKRKHLGCFKSKADAINARLEAEKMLHPYSARVNPPN